MTKKRKRLEEELAKLNTKKAEIEEKIQETEAQITEEENTEIQGIVRAANLTPEQLAEFLKTLKATVPGKDPEEMIGEESK